MKAHHFLFLLTSFLLFNHAAWAQNNDSGPETDRSTLYWTRYYNIWSITDKIKLNTEIDNRRFIQEGVQFQTLLRTTLTFSTSDHLTLGAGGAYSVNYTRGTSIIGIPEIRPHQQVELKHGPRRFQIEHRFRLEEQFNRDTIGVALAETYDFSLRGRYKVQFAYKLLDRKKDKGSLSLQLNSEVMAKARKKESFDQFRVYGGISYYMLEKLQLDLGYMKYLERKYRENKLSNFDVLRLTLRHSI